MKLATQGSFQANESNTHQQRIVARGLALLVTVVGLACAFYLVPKNSLEDSAIRAVTADLPPYWAWLEAGDAEITQIRVPDPPVITYSVIPGGVENREELTRALAHDAVAARHYSGFRAAAARPIRLKNAREVYVSYRLGNQIYWTSKKVTLHTGETVLTDGAHLVRARCGNRISEVPLLPTAPAEPAEPVLNAPVLRRDPVDTADLPAAPIWTENPTPFLLAMAPPVSGSPAPGSTPFVPPFPLVPCCGGGVSSHTPRPPPVRPVVPPGAPGPPPVEPPEPPSPAKPVVPAPEPEILELLLVGVASLMTVVKLRRN